MNWHISIFSPDGRRLIFAAKSDSVKEIQALAATARATSSSLMIFIRSPTGAVQAWD